MTLGKSLSSSPIPSRFTPLTKPKPGLKTGEQILRDHRRLAVNAKLLDAVSVRP